MTTNTPEDHIAGVSKLVGANAIALDALNEDQWLELAERHAAKDWDCAEPDGYLEAVKALCADFAAIAALEAEPQPEADMFWDHDDPESFGHDIEDLVAERDLGDEFKVDCAMRLPSIKVRVIAGETEDDDNTWEEVLPATPPKD